MTSFSTGLWRNIGAVNKEDREQSSKKNDQRRFNADSRGGRCLLYPRFLQNQPYDAAAMRHRYHGSHSIDVEIGPIHVQEGLTCVHG